MKFILFTLCLFALSPLFASNPISIKELPYQDSFSNVLRFKNLYYTINLPENSYLVILPVTQEICTEGVSLNKYFNGSAKKVIDVCNPDTTGLTFSIKTIEGFKVSYILESTGLNRGTYDHEVYHALKFLDPIGLDNFNHYIKDITNQFIDLNDFLDEEDAAAVVAVLSSVGSGIKANNIKSKHSIHLKAKESILASGLMPGAAFILDMKIESFEHKVFSLSKDIHRVTFDVNSVSGCSESFSPSFIENKISGKEPLTFYYIDKRKDYLKKLMNVEKCT
jgi:hypothetical protein